MDNYPQFIVFEGADNVGKSTQAEALESFFKAQNIPVWRTAEPTRDSIYGKTLREVPNLSNLEMILLILLDRNLHVQEIESYLSRGCTVICDRFYWSSLAYNAIDELTLNLISENIIENVLTPDLVIYLRTSEINLPEKPSDCIAEKMEQQDKQEQVIRSFQNILDRNSTIPVIEVNGDLPFDFNTRFIEQKIIAHNQNLNEVIDFVRTPYYVPC